MRTHAKIMILTTLLLALISSLQAQIRPYVEIYARPKMEISMVQTVAIGQPYSTSKMLVDPGLALGVEFPKTGLGLQIEARYSNHNGRFLIKNNPGYSAFADQPAIDFGSDGIFVPISLTWKKGFGADQKWGLRAKAGFGIIYVNGVSFFEDLGREITITSSITGSPQPFKYTALGYNYVFSTAMTETAIGTYFKLGTQFELNASISATQSFKSLGTTLVDYVDGNQRSNTLNVRTDGQAYGLQIGLRYFIGAE